MIHNYGGMVSFNKNLFTVDLAIDPRYVIQNNYWVDVDSFYRAISKMEYENMVLTIADIPKVWKTIDGRYDINPSTVIGSIKEIQLPANTKEGLNDLWLSMQMVVESKPGTVSLHNLVGQDLYALQRASFSSTPDQKIFIHQIFCFDLCGYHNYTKKGISPL